MTTYALRPVGHVESVLTDLAAAPRQPGEGAPDAWLVAGVFATRSRGRPNPIGLHDVHVVAVEGTRVHVSNLEALNGTPILDLKPVLTPEH